jgi:hypothetical protein
LQFESVIAAAGRGSISCEKSSRMKYCHVFRLPCKGRENGIKYKGRQLVGVLYIPLVPPEARAALHSALASFMKTAAKLCSILRSFWLPFSAGKGVLSGKATSPLCPPRGTKGITH